MLMSFFLLKYCKNTYHFVYHICARPSTTLSLFTPLIANKTAQLLCNMDFSVQCNLFRNGMHNINHPFSYPLSTSNLLLKPKGRRAFNWKQGAWIKQNKEHWFFSFFSTLKTIKWWKNENKWGIKMFAMVMSRFANNVCI